MKKTVNVNIGGMVFTINEDAYSALESYLKILRTYFRETEGSEEIMEDIEVRIAEILKEHLGKRVVIEMSDIDAVKATIGYPQDFEMSANEEGSRSYTSEERDKKKKQVYLGKRLFRNPDDKVLGGVCSGLGAYFGIDPVWIRLAFVVATVFIGTGFWLYIILWIVIPEAKTPTEKLQMRGEPVNVDNIKQSFQEEFQHVKERVQNLASEAQNWVQDQKKNDPVKDFFNNLSALFRGIVRILGHLFFVFVSLLAIIVLTAVVFSLLTGSTVMAISIPFLQQYIFNSEWQMWLILIGSVLMVLIPITWLFIRIFTSAGMSKRAKNILDMITAIAWGVAVWMLIPAVLSLGYDFNERAVVREKENINIASDTLFVHLDTDEYRLDEYESGRARYDGIIRIHDDDFDIIGDTLLVGDFELKKTPSRDSLFHLNLIYSARGRTRSEARRRARAIEFQYRIRKNHLILKPYFSLGEEPYRVQSVKALIQVPEGKTLIMDRE